MGITWSYLELRYPIFHHLAYSLLVLVLVFSRISNILAIQRAYGDRPGNPAAFCWRLFAVTLGLYCAAFAAWLIDSHACEALQNARAQLADSLGFFWGEGVVGGLLQFHSWWHVLSSFAVYLEVIHGSYARLLLAYKDEYRTKIHYYWNLLPWIESLPIAKAKGGKGRYEE